MSSHDSVSANSGPELIERLWESDEASALTNEAAREIERLRSAIDNLWGELEVGSVKWLREHNPELVELCQQIHHDLWHATTHEERAVKGGR